MLWLTWRQHRMQVLVTTALLAVLGVVLLISALGTAAFAAENAPAADCVADTPVCGAYLVEMNERIRSVEELLSWLPLLAPAMIGAFWGAPLLAREFEQGTHQLTWTQCALFRRTLPAMAVTLAVCALAFFGLLRAPSSYATPERVVQATVMDEPGPDDALHVTSYWIDESGVEYTAQERDLALAVPCGTDATTKKYARCSFSHGYRQVTEFHPADRFWQFQWTEAGIIPALSLGGLAVRRTLRPRI
ncbi:hypothetical protein AB0K40_11350 [Nonomuraea bangladeshensis]|uniref:ABC transporter permease n=1 Tax=Nonomuraea bangladeshensis TaxID=404385 RepID=A0ABV3H0L2_9ACTN